MKKVHEEFRVDFKEKNRYFEREDSHCSVLLGIKIHFFGGEMYWSFQVKLQMHAKSINQRYSLAVNSTCITKFLSYFGPTVFSAYHILHNIIEVITATCLKTFSLVQWKWQFLYSLSCIINTVEKNTIHNFYNTNITTHALNGKIKK